MDATIQPNDLPSPKEVAKPTEWDRSTTIFVLLVLVVLIVGVYGIVVLLDRTVTAETLQSTSVKLAVSVAMLVGAILLYMVKVSSAQFVYGLAEIAVGLVANWRSLESLSRQLAMPKGEDPLFARLAVLAGGLYLIGRGVANFSDGMSRLMKEKKTTK
jgi:hypothetical protein